MIFAGDSWKVLSRNSQNIQFLESTNFDILYGIDQNNVLYYANKLDLNQLDEKWRRVANLDTISNNGDDVSEISCNHFSCWVVTTSGTVYSMKTPWDPTKAEWTRDYGKAFSLVFILFGVHPIFNIDPVISILSMFNLSRDYSFTLEFLY